LSFSPHPWPMERHDPQGTLYTPIVGPQNPGVMWTFQDPAGFSGGPVVAQDGTLYLAGGSQKLYALSAQGKLIWQVDLPEPPLGAPALSAAGEIYVVGNKGGIIAVKPDGTTLWSLPSNRGIATSGPIVAVDGTIYYTIIDSVRVVSAQGELLALWPVSRFMSDVPPRLSPDEQWILLHEGAVSRLDGSKLDVRPLNDEGSEFSDPVFVVGANGQAYFRSGHGLTRWEAQGSLAENLGKISWDPKGLMVAYPTDAGVSASGLGWMVYTGDYFETRIAWINDQSLLVDQARLTYMGSRVIGVDQKEVLYACTTSGSVICYAMQPGKKQPLWSLEMTDGTRAVGGALLPGRMLVATQNGILYSLEDTQP
jgi:streptogramin lyase